MMMLKYLIQLILICFLSLVANQVFAVEYYCEATKKIDLENEYSAEMIKKYKYANKLEEVGNKAFVSRCSFSKTEEKVTCDRCEVDRD